MNKHLKLLILFASTLCLTYAAPGMTADPAKVGQTAAQRHKVIFQVSDDDPRKWNLALNNAKNVQTDLGAANVDVEIVAYGPGIGMLKLDSPTGNRVSEALSKGIQVVACENTMRNMKIGKSDMLPAIGYVDAGVVELMRRQREGYAYIRP